MRLPVTLVAAACCVGMSGCASVIGSAYLRDAWLDQFDRLDHAAQKAPVSEREPRSDAGDDASDAVVTDDSPAPGQEAPIPPAGPANLEDAVAAAAERLRQSGGLSTAARATLVATLEATPRQDWPIVIEEFAAALAMAHDGAGSASSSAGEGSAAVAVAKLPAASAAPAVEAAAAAPLPTADRGPAPAVRPPESEEPARAWRETPPVPERQPEPPVREHASPEPATPALAVRNACFASRVRAWGVVDRFETAGFRPGQELIVYFELEDVAARESAEGHTTRIDTRLSLVGADGRGIHGWRFEPLEETCGNRRRDYFARYLIAVPESAPAGQCRLELSVSDMIGGRTAHATLPLEVLPR
jgi:hypothetical protein